MENFMKTSESGNLNHILIKYFLPYNNSIFTDSDLKTSEYLDKLIKLIREKKIITR